MSGTTAPSQAGFIAWIRQAMGVGTDILPDDSIWITYAYRVSLALNNPLYACVSPLIYELMVYNLGGDNLINWTQDPIATPPAPQSTFWKDLRKSFKIGNFVAGVITSASDNGSSDSVTVPDFFKELTLSQLGNLKTPYGRTYLQYAQMSGSDWGVS